MDDNGRILPIEAVVQSFTEHESTNSEFFNGESDAQMSTLDVSTQKKGIFYNDTEIPYSFKHERAEFHGEFKDDTDNNTLGESMLDNSSMENGSMVSITNPFNRIRSIPPFQGGLDDYFDMLADKVGYESRRDIRWNSKNPVLTIQGYFGNVFENFSVLLSTLPTPYEMVAGSNIIIVRPRRRHLITPDMFMGGLPSVDYKVSSASKYVKVAYYKQKWGNNLCVYPDINSDELKAETVLSVENYCIYDYEDTVQEFQLNGSLKSINSSSWPKKDDNSPIGSIGSVIKGPTGSRGEPLKIPVPVDKAVKLKCKLMPIIESNFNDGKPDECYGFVGGRWAFLGISLYFAETPAQLATDAKAGVLAWCAENEVYYYCTASYIPAQKDTPEVEAQWFPWGEPFLVPDKEVLKNRDKLKEYMEQKDFLDNLPLFNGYRNGWYTVMDCNNHPIMPSEWEKGHEEKERNGSLTVELLKETDKIKVTLHGADISLDCPIYGSVPDYEIYKDGKRVDLVGVDLRGVITKDTIFYAWNDAEKKWDMDKDVNPFPRAPYKICTPHFDTERNGLYIMGDGIRYIQDFATIESQLYDDKDTEEDDEQITHSIDCHFVVDENNAYKFADLYDKNYNGVTYTFSGSIWHPNDSEFVRLQRGSWEAVLDYAVYHGYGTGKDSWEAFTDWWKKHLNNEEYTRQDIDRAVMEGTSHHISHNLFSNVAGAYIIVPQRGAFRILSADIDVGGCSVSGEEVTTLGDWDVAIRYQDLNYTLGDWDKVIEQIEKDERVGAYIMHHWAKEFFRLE